MNKHYWRACGLAAAIAIPITLFLCLSAAISWVLIWAMIAFALIPVMQWCEKFIEDHNCFSPDDFFIKLQKYFQEKEEKNKSSIDFDSDW